MSRFFRTLVLLAPLTALGCGDDSSPGVGVDAAVVDASVRDASGFDAAGSDAAGFDAAGFDAMLVDASVRDASSDRAVPDACAMATETCDNGLDDDCDGVPDDGCSCTIGATRPCYGGAPAMIGVGTCREGTQSCEGTAPAPGAWGDCIGDVVPVPESCANADADDDCDGMGATGTGDVDGLGDPCATGRDGICMTGSMTCVSGAASCVGPDPGLETCNASDDDCDGMVDDGTDQACYPLGTPGCDLATSLCVGRCVLGTRTCTAGMLGACMGATTPAPEICCNMIDDDCDTFVDGADSDCTSSGAVTWAQRFGGVGSDSGQAVAALPDRGAIVVGNSGGSGVVIRYAADGSVTWSRSFSGGGGVAGVAVLADGSAFVTGAYTGSVTFAPGVSRTSLGSSDVYVARFDSTGALVWLRSSGGTSADNGLGIVVLGDGTLMVVGSVASSTSTFGAGEPGATTLTSSGAFLARYASDGSLMWARVTGDADSRALARRSDDSVVVVGTFSGSATFGSGEPATTTLTAASTDAFVAGHRADGSFISVRQHGGTDGEDAWAVDTYADDSFVVAGSYAGTAVFGAGDAAEATLVSAGGSDSFVARFDPSGELLWARSGGGGRGDVALGVAARSDGGVVVTGRYGSLAATFGDDGTGCMTTLTPNASGTLSTDVFVVRYSPTGAVLWARKGGGMNVDRGTAVDISDDGGAIVTGAFASIATFGTFMLTMSDTMADGFAVRYSP